MYRLWGRIRSAVAKQWENEKLQRGYFNVAAGKHVGDAIWRSCI